MIIFVFLVITCFEIWSRGTSTIVLCSGAIVITIKYRSSVYCHVRCSETVSNSFEAFITLPEVKQIHSGVQNYSTAPIKLMKKLIIRSCYLMFIYTNNNN